MYADEGLVAEYDEEGNEIRSYGYKPDSTWGTDPLWLKQDEEYFWYQNDHLDTPQKLIDSSGTVVWSAQYTTFGEADVQVETVTNNLRFPGQYEDAETGLLYNFHRYYDPEIGRYTKVDPIGFDGGDVNWYAYVRNNPGNSTDPIGWLTITACSNLWSDASSDASNCLGFAMTGRTDACWAVDNTQRPEDSFQVAITKAGGGTCTPITSIHDCPCSGKQTVILISLVIPLKTEPQTCDSSPEQQPKPVAEQCQRNRDILANGTPWTDPTFWFGGMVFGKKATDRWHLSDYHAIRGELAKGVWEQVSNLNLTGPAPSNLVTPEQFEQYFPENHPMLCCCK